MTPSKRLLFADIDGTLWCGAERPGVLRRRLVRAARAATVVLASSRTVEEILEIQARVRVESDFIAENGAQIGLRDPRLAAALGGAEPGGSGPDPLWLADRAVPLAELLPVIAAAARRHGLESHLAQAPGWPRPPSAPGDPAPPPCRRSSLLLPRDLFRDGRHATFRADLEGRGLDLVDGGEWTSISKKASKAAAATAYADAWRRLIGAAVATAGIGNSDNDESLLRAVDQAFVIRNPEGHSPVLARIGGARLLARRACAGWHEAMALLESGV